MKKSAMILCLVMLGGVLHSLSEQEIFRNMFSSFISTNEHGAVCFDQESMHNFCFGMSANMRELTLLYCADLAQQCFDMVQDDSWKTLYAQCRYVAAHSVWRDTCTDSLRGIAALHIARMWHDGAISYVLYNDSLEHVRELHDVVLERRIKTGAWPCALDQLAVENALNTLWPLLTKQGATQLKNKLDAFGQELQNSTVSDGKNIYRCCSWNNTANHCYAYTVYWLVEALKGGNVEAHAFFKKVQDQQDCPVDTVRWVRDGINSSCWKKEYERVKTTLRPSHQQEAAAIDCAKDRQAGGLTD